MLSTGDGATAHLAELIAGAGLRPGDAFCLKGDEGASQDIFVRAFLRAVLDQPDKVVAAPTGTLEPVTYSEHAGPAIQHLNLRNVPTPGDAERGNLVASFAPVVSLVESAERLQEWGAAPEQRLAIWMRQLPPKLPSRLMLLSDDLTASMIKGLPESMLLQAVKA
ncbi:hypothetical protein MNEG_4709 [Monoraphidium neglectum]|uniref:Uncharacterized protein n=1 Tax=Monoraphidium neglectum TaxID=145388 RepID=A0A0D2MS81_9CHLO|nr:hypothetical protein MNEG_4709 [Monoraphidium neglectum]KIZ03252.1 hypothetical protein MNEG_4709 [Monoraphidium neglectum]|eukprot:XP_013902271.1 hypothetical protein MNEG_4709 [Monoraphidium neglectum]